MMKKIALASAVLAAAFAAPAAAQTYSLTNNFGDAVFQYGTVANGSFTSFTRTTCTDVGASGTCFRGSDMYQVEYRRDSGRLVVHPGPNDGNNSFLLFTAPTTGIYTYDVTLTRGDSGDGVNVFTFNNSDGTMPQVGTINAANPIFLAQYSQFLTAGTQVGLGIDRGGARSNYNNDSTFFSGTITGPAGAGAVPEPASWALMIVGFGAVGGAMRRRAKVRTTVRFA